MKARAALLACLLAACGADDGGSTVPDARALGDAAPDGGGSFTTCTGACRTTTLTATFGSDTAMFDRAVYGITTAGATQTLHVEAYSGGDPGCPTEQSATPDYTAILGQVVVPTDTTPSSSPGNLLDFTGDLLDGPLGAAATMVTVTPGAADPAANPAFVALEVSMTFAAGTISGHVFATHCASLDESQ
ncbi:MAG: hypothetical protein SFX73_02985 [Kofleriaceae bacterium]|nr:hypothetical protein [Kofleriaceae bacterium]